MEDMVVTLLLDLSVATLLGATIFYCIKLNHRIQILQDSKSELAQLIKQFDESTQQATVSINEIHRASKRINQNIQEKLDKANYLADDLAFMIDRANKTADKIEHQISEGRQVEGKARTSTAAGNERRATSDRSSRKREERTRSERSEARRTTSPEIEDEPANPDDKKGIEAMMERISELRSGRQESAKTKRPVARLRSKSEQDLLQALKQRDAGKG